MNAQLRARRASIDDNLEWVYSDDPKVIPGRAGEGMWLDCEVTQPKSRAGGTVSVHIPPNLIPGLFRELRRQMIRDRSEGEHPVRT